MNESAATRVVMKVTLFVLTLIQASLVFAQDQSPSEKVTNDPAKRSKVFKQTLPNLDYRKVEVITVEYAPGASFRQSTGTTLRCSPTS